MGKLKSIGGLWRAKSGNGYTGKLDNRLDASLLRPGTRILLFANKEKRNDREPDLRLMVEDLEQQGERHREEMAPVTSAADDDIPF